VAIAYPIAVGAISLVFAAIVARGRRAHHLVWAIALIMSSLASLAYVGALRDSAAAFRIYYVLGGLLMPAWLGLGSIYFVAPRPIADAALAALVNVGAIGAGAVFAAGIDHEALVRLDGGPGTGVLEPGAWLPITILLNTAGVAAVVGVAIFSGVRLAQRRGTGRLVLANALIAIGDLIVGAAGAMARTGLPQLFWMTMLTGWIVIFSGFLLSSTGSLPGSGRNSPRPWAAPTGKTPAA